MNQLPFFILLTAIVVSGCTPLMRSRLSERLPTKTTTKTSPLEPEYRERFLTERDPEALRWLLSNRIHNEMTVTEVANVLGEKGERRFDDREYKTNGGFYQTTDVGYQWGPDKNGHSVVLFFRDGKLVHFDPAEFL
jgi:hypothetical protein